MSAPPPAPGDEAASPKPVSETRRGRVDFDAQDREVSDDLRGRTARGGAYTVGVQALKTAVQTGSVAVLGRLLTPDDFGLVAVVTSVTGFVLLFREMGLPMAMVQAKTLDHGRVNTVFWISVVMGTVLALINAALAPLVAALFGDPRLTAVMLAMSVLFVLGAATRQHAALLRRSMRLGTVQGLQLAGQVVGVSTAIVLAGFFGVGYWALVASQIIAAVVFGVGCWWSSGWLPSAPKWAPGTWAMVRYGGELTVSNMMTYWSKNLDNLLIGKVWGTSSLGVYSKAYGLLLLPVQQFTRPMAGVLIPGLSRLQEEPERFVKFLYRGMHLLSFVCLPTVALLAVFSDEVIRVVLGPQWGEAGPLFRALAFAALCEPLVAGCAWVWLATGRTARMLRFSVVQTVLIVVAFGVTVAYGPWWMAVALSGVTVVTLWPRMMYAAAGTGATPGGMVRAVAGPAVASGLAAAAAGAWAYFAPAGLGPAVRLLVGVGVGSVVYFVVAWLAGDLARVIDAAKSLRQAKRKPKAVPAASELPAVPTS